MDDICGEWVKCMGVASGCGEQEAGVASGSGWNLWVCTGVAVQKRLARRIRGCEAAESPREALEKFFPLFFLTAESAVAFVQSCITINSSPAALRVLWRFVGST